MVPSIVLPYDVTAPVLVGLEDIRKVVPITLKKLYSVNGN
jgi:hypothetical protein